MASGRFAMAVHALAVLAQSDEGYPSEFLAGSVNTHAVFLRRVLSALLKAGIVEAREGRNGGYRLSRRAEQITLAEVYEAMEPEGPLSPSPAEPNAKCPVGAGMRAAFLETAHLARNGVASALEAQTVADVARRALRHGKRK